MINYEISIGNIIEIISIVGGGMMVFATLKSNVALLKEEVSEMQLEIKKMGEILVSMARFDERLANIDKRVTSHGHQIDDLRHRKGLTRNTDRPSGDGE